VKKVRKAGKSVSVIFREKIKILVLWRLIFQGQQEGHMSRQSSKRLKAIQLFGIIPKNDEQKAGRGICCLDVF